MYKFKDFDEADVVILENLDSRKANKDEYFNLYEVSPEFFVKVMSIIPCDKVSGELAYVINDVIEDKKEYSRNSYYDIAVMQLAGQKLIGNAIKQRLVLRANEVLENKTTKILGLNDDIKYYDTFIYLDADTNEIVNIDVFFEAFDDIVHICSINKLNEKHQIALLSFLPKKILQDPKILEALSKPSLNTSTWAHMERAGECRNGLKDYGRKVDVQKCMDEMKKIKPLLYNYIGTRLVEEQEPGSGD